MGQRLNIEIWNEGTVLANAYYHWSGYTKDSAKLVNAALKFINENPVDNENILRYAIRALEATGAGFTESEVQYAKKTGLELNAFSECRGRNHGLISISEEGMQDTRNCQECAVYIYLDENRISFNVFFEKSHLEWEREQKEEYRNQDADFKSLDVVHINFDDIKFSKWNAAFNILFNAEEPFRSNINKYKILCPIAWD